MTNKKHLDTLLEEILSEDNPADVPMHAQDVAPLKETKEVSLDQVVDRYIIRYEKESIPTTETYENELYGENNIPHYSSILEEALTEAPGDEEEVVEPDEEPADAGLDLGLDSPEGDSGDEETGEEQPVMATPRINLQDFARSAARLVNNFSELINVHDIILNRLEEYVKINYDERTARELMDILDENYSLRSMETIEANQEDLPTPYTAGALSSDG